MFGFRKKKTEDYTLKFNKNVDYDLIPAFYCKGDIFGNKVLGFAVTEIKINDCLYLAGKSFKVNYITKLNEDFAQVLTRDENGALDFGTDIKSFVKEQIKLANKNLPPINFDGKKPTSNYVIFYKEHE